MIIVWLFCIGIVLYGALIGWVYLRETSVPSPEGYDSIIVLGAQVQKSGEPSVQLRWRLDRAKEVYWAKPCYIVVTGGQGENEPAPEGDVMRALLVDEGLDEAHVIGETKSMDTQENLRYAWEILQGLGCKAPVVVTSDYHLPRAMAIMEDVGMEPRGVGSLCKPGLKFWLKNHMREALAWVKYWGIKYLGLPL